MINLLLLFLALLTPRVFLVYSSKDFHTATALYEKLEGAGCNVWMDRKNMLAGRWPALIEAAIDSSTHVVWLLPAERCDYCEDEIIRARRKKKEIVPVATKNARMSILIEGYNLVSWEEVTNICPKLPTPPAPTLSAWLLAKK